MADKKPEPKTNTMKKPAQGKGDADREAITHKHGDLVHFEHGDEEAGVTVRGKGRIVASGADGVTVQTDDGREHKIRHAALRSGKSTMKKAADPILIFAKGWSPPTAAAAPRRAQTVPNTGTPLLIMEKGGAAYIGAHTRVSKTGKVTTIAPHTENRHERPDEQHRAVAKPGERHAIGRKHLTDAEVLLEQAREREAKAHEKHDTKRAEQDQKQDEKHHYSKDGRDGADGDDEKDADGKPKKKKGAGKAPPFVKKSDDFGGMPVLVFGMAAAAAADSSSAGDDAPVAPVDASLAGGNPPAADAPREPEPLADPRASYTQRAIAAFRSFWNPGKGSAA